jgi:pyruvate,water dikinase
MAVVVQRLVPAALAGVLFTADPVSGSHARMVGSYVLGLGDRLVAGEASGHAFTLARPRGRYAGPAALRRYGGRLFALAARLEAELSGPQDLEWAIAGGRLYLLQARPITTLRAHDPATGEWNDSLAGDYLWTNTNYSEAVPDVMTPATWSLLQRFMNELLPVRLPGQHPLIGNIGGRFYLNVSAIASVFASLGFGREAIWKETEEFYGRFPRDLEVPLIPFALWPLLKTMVPFGIAAKRRVTRDRGRLPELLKDAPARAAALLAEIARAETPAMLAEVWETKLAPAFKQTSQTMQAATSGYENAARPLRHQLTRQVGLEDANALLSGVSAGGPLASLGPVLGLWQVAQGALSREDYAAQCGHRGAHELEVSWPRPAEDAQWIEAQLAAQRAAPVDVPALLRQQQAQHAAAWARYAARYPRRASAVRRQLDAAAEAARGREVGRSELTRIFGVARALALRAGRLTGLGDDIFFLSFEEMAALLRGEAAGREAAGTIAARKATHARYSALPAYPSLINGRFDPFRWAADPRRRTDIFDAHARSAADAAQAGATLTGFAGAAGVVEGVVRVLESVEAAHTLLPGEVLVAATTNIGWTPAFPRAAAVVTDVGAPLSHAAIVARELGIPAVVGTGTATMRLRTGDRVRVNGGLGTVEILV